MKVTRYLRYAMAALTLCFGSFAYAGDDLRPWDTVKFMVAQVGSHGADQAQFQAEQTFAYTGRTQSQDLTASLLTASHGFLQASADEVTKGTTGSTVSLTIS